VWKLLEVLYCKKYERICEEVCPFRNTVCLDRGKKSSGWSGAAAYRNGYNRRRYWCESKKRKRDQRDSATWFRERIQPKRAKVEEYIAAIEEAIEKFKLIDPTDTEKWYWAVKRDLYKKMRDKVI
jgi:hypothetical protein